MVIERELQLALVVSLLAHIFILTHKIVSGSVFNKITKTRELEVRYIKKLPQDIEISQQAQMRPPALSRPPSLPREPLLDTSRVTPVAAMRPPPPFIQNSGPGAGMKNQEIIFNKPALIKTGLVGIKKKVSLPLLDADKINNPSYISYYQIVREKIKRAAYQNYTGSETGEIIISFSISQDGYVKGMHLVENKTFSAYLRQIALNSIKEAAPFPKFPKGLLDYPQLTFNVAITFEVE
ncbi:MAG: hypothetical protein ABSB18_01670 [Candidatus Omnitrophota bacterium]